LRRDALCPGPVECAPAQIEQPEVHEADVQPCLDCPLEMLNAYLQSPAGRVMQLVVDLDFALERRMTVTLEQVSYLEFQMLRVLGEEKVRWQTEEIEKQAKRR
jgi:hypothetical protein